ncbi:glycosyltransferase family 4 protein [Gordonibacter pamelaeae]|uniref:glycosyltransferase family 4 protein n=1 Tax=Gordonibacter pamelaeae TaxID=471189 RepID=UPI00242B58D0|nr:glycosyltransferase family 4 protein [Gordonibacter pamelaeae]
MGKPKILFINSLPNFYRCGFFNALEQVFDTNVLFTKRREEACNRPPSFFYNMKEAKFSYEFAHGVRLGKYKFSFNVPWIARQHFDCRVVGLLDDLISLRVAEYFIESDKPFLLSLDGVGRRSQLVDFAYSRYIEAAEACLSPSEMTDDYIRDLSSSRKTIYRYPLSSFSRKEIDPRPASQEEKAELKSCFGLERDVPVLLGVGQVIPRKGFDCLVEALRLIFMPVCLLIVGGESIELEKVLSATAPQHKVLFVRDVKHDELSRYYRAADIFVLPTRGDSWGLVVPEAMSHGLPVVTTTACGAGVELVTKDTGMLVKPDDVKELANALLKLLITPDLRNEMGQNGISRVGTWTIEGMAEATSEIIFSYLNTMKTRG